MDLRPARPFQAREQAPPWALGAWLGSRGRRRRNGAGCRRAWTTEDGVL